MKIINLNKTPSKPSDAEVGVALGNFDGLHRGHVKLIKSMIDESKKRGLKSSVLLFKEHTKLLLERETRINLLSSTEEKINIFRDLGVDIVYIIDFNQELMELSGQDFIKNILIDKMNVKLITVGFDYRFGFKAQSTSDDLVALAKNYNIETNILDAIYIEGELISSTLIKSLLKEGKIKEANKLLGRKFEISGEVVHGKKIGHGLGFPTANIKNINNIILPKTGVYSTLIKVKDKEYKSVTNIGYNPTFEGESLTIESHILDFEGNIYGDLVSLKFIDYIRNDKKFDSKESLIKQIESDIEKVINS